LGERRATKTFLEIEAPSDRLSQAATAHSLTSPPVQKPDSPHLDRQWPRVVSHQPRRKQCAKALWRECGPRRHLPQLGSGPQAGPVWCAPPRDFDNM